MSLPPPSTIIRGRTWVWPDDVNTDIIIPFRFKARTNDPVEMAKYAMYGFDPEFYKKVKPGDLFVAGRNFGGGSSRVQAPQELSLGEARRQCGKLNIINMAK